MDTTHEIPEEWKDIPGFSRYKLSNYGRIHNIRTGKYNSGCVNKDGYLQYVLLNDKDNPCKKMAHILVAKAFIPNNQPKRKRVVNHKDEDKSNPYVGNLEWMTYKENTNYGTTPGRIGLANRKPINEYNINGRYIRTWKHAEFPARVYGATSRLIQSAAAGKTQTALGRQWRYLKGDDVSNIEPITNKHVLKYNKDVNCYICIPSEYLYTVRKLTGAELYADKLDEMIYSPDIPKYFIADLKQVREYLLKQCG
jgi:hypothetical protein